MNTVKPIKNMDKLISIQEQLEEDRTPHGQRVYLLFMVGIYTGLRISDIVPLTVGQCRAEVIELVEEKTGKKQELPVHPALKEVFRYAFADANDKDFLFPSMRRREDGKEKHITTRDAYNDLKKVYARFGLKGAYGCHTLRKTFGYWHYQRNKNLESLRVWFNHASQEVTRRYICIDEDEQRKELNNLDFGFRPSKPAKVEPAALKRGKGEPVSIKRLDRTENGRKWGAKKREKLQKSKAQKGAAAGRRRSAIYTENGG